MSREKKETEVRVRVTDSQREKWERAAAASGHTLSSLIRHAADLFAAKVLRRRAP